MLMDYLGIYKEIGQYSEALGSSHWQQIKLLFEKLSADLLHATTALQRQDIPLKCKKLVNAYEITLYLRDCLDFNINTELTERIDKILYHLQNTIFIANAQNDLDKIKNALIISQNLREWWSNVQH
jgi:flagellar biosynthetic protein FliS